MKSRIHNSSLIIGRNWPLALLWLVIIVMFSPILFSDKTLCLLDYSRHYYPMRAYAASCLESGLLPLWNPLIYCGFPQVGEIQVSVLYPLSWLLLLGDFTVALEVYIMLHYLIAAASAYFLGRSLTLSGGGSLILAIFYAMNGHLLMSHQAPPALCSLAYLPLVIACFYRFLARGERNYLWLGYLALALQISAGYPITVYQTLLALGFLGCLSLYSTRRQKVAWPRLGWSLAGLFAALGLSAAMLLPFLELVSFTARVAEGGFREMVMFSVPGRAFLSLFSPAYFGSPASLEYDGPVRVAWLGAYYGGPVLLFLACFAVLR